MSVASRYITKAAAPTVARRLRLRGYPEANITKCTGYALNVANRLDPLGPQRVLRLLQDILDSLDAEMDQGVEGLLPSWPDSTH